MANDYLEPEEQVQEVIDINPLDEAVNEKAYSRPNFNATTEDLNKPIEEPRFAPPPIQKPTVEREDPRKREPVNPEFSGLPKKDKEMAASHMAKLILQGYEWMHDLGNKGLKVSEKKLNKLQAEGEMNLNAMIDYDYGKKMRAGDFFKEYNQQVEGILKVSDEFKEEVTPVLERVLAKRGVGMTDEQLLMFMFGKDIAAKSMMFFQQKQQLNFMIQSIKEATAGQFVQQAPPQQQPQQQPQQEPQQQAQSDTVYTPDEEEDFSVISESSNTGSGIKPDIIVAPKRRGRPKR
jgi:hypothetical protein